MGGCRAGESLEDYQRGWSEEIEDAIERFTGRLNAEQLDYLKRKSVMYQPERVLWGDIARDGNEIFSFFLDQIKVLISLIGLSVNEEP
ncbi:MAG: hypothetical protein Ct9H90mP27_2210 [Gammaproteobacteria bacterium]|nr:MAG: hypothetical protein Ct9H90mP27_2210 [Gammaproteobacteria bacterium]